MEFPSFEIKTEADSNYINECSQDDRPSTGEFVLSDAKFSAINSRFITSAMMIARHCLL